MAPGVESAARACPRPEPMRPRGRQGARRIAALALALTACGQSRAVEPVAPSEGSAGAPSAHPGGDPALGLPPGHPPIGAGSGAPAADGAPAAAAIAATMTQGANGLAWQAPPGWRRAPERAMRVVTFQAGPEEEAAECYVSEISGDAGGVEANIARWCGQMGAPALSAAELDALPRVPILGLDAPLVEVAGSYRGMGGEQVPDALLVGAVVPRGAGTLFIKLTGPRALVESQRDAFLAFCKSLHEEN